MSDSKKIVEGQGSSVYFHYLFVIHVGTVDFDLKCYIVGVWRCAAPNICFAASTEMLCKYWTMFVAEGSGSFRCRSSEARGPGQDQRVRTSAMLTEVLCQAGPVSESSSPRHWEMDIGEDEDANASLDCPSCVHRRP
jgi:hypothetical protein